MAMQIELVDCRAKAETETGMTGKQLAGLVLALLCLIGFVVWSIQPSDQTETNLFVRSLVGGLLGGGAVLSWAFLVRKRTKKPD